MRTLHKGDAKMLKIICRIKAKTRIKRMLEKYPCMRDLISKEQEKDLVQKLSDYLYDKRKKQAHRECTLDFYCKYCRNAWKYNNLTICGASNVVINRDREGECDNFTC